MQQVNAQPAQRSEVMPDDKKAPEPKWVPPPALWNTDPGFSPSIPETGWVCPDGFTPTWKNTEKNIVYVESVDDPPVCVADNPKGSE